MSEGVVVMDEDVDDEADAPRLTELLVFTCPICLERSFFAFDFIEHLEEAHAFAGDLEEAVRTCVTCEAVLVDAWTKRLATMVRERILAFHDVATEDALAVTTRDYYHA